MKDFLNTRTARAFLFTIGILAVANASVWYSLYIEEGRRELTVAFLDVGQGDAIFIEAPNGNQVLVDAGPNSKVLSELGKVMPWYDKSIDMIIVTNPDKDHIGGFIDVLKRFKVNKFLEPGTENKTLTNSTLHDLVESNGIEKLRAVRGMNIVLDEKKGIVLSVLFPDRDVSEESSNDGSIVMRLIYGETEVMLTGDASLQVEREVLEHAEAIQSDILKVGHHGSRTSTSKEFLETVRPAFAVISLGRANKYGHPHQEVIGTLDSYGAKILRTDELGTIVMKSDGGEFVLQN
ncbi:MAG TPA: ComEC/Rec2 family competence protein [Candidatus Nanoarchaeia archaeon]|nr:ComEC/Rec2 family competence protein [Candidatus Nanoarchaeia archaeon]